MGENDKGDIFDIKVSLRAKSRCQLIIRLKAIKYKKDIFYYLSSYINVLSRLQLGPSLPLYVASDFQYQSLNTWSLYRCFIGNVTFYLDINNICPILMLFGLIVFCSEVFSAFGIVWLIIFTILFQNTSNLRCNSILEIMHSHLRIY